MEPCIAKELKTIVIGNVQQLKGNTEALGGITEVLGRNTKVVFFLNLLVFGAVLDLGPNCC